jgi:hypothetical protein
VSLAVTVSAAPEGGLSWRWTHDDWLISRTVSERFCRWYRNSLSAIAASVHRGEQAAGATTASLEGV